MSASKLFSQSSRHTDVVRNEQDFVGHDQRSDDQEEQRVATRKLHPRQWVRGQDVDHEDQRGAGAGHDQAVQKRADQVDAARDGQDSDVVL